MDVFKEDLTKFAFYFQPIDKEFSRFLVTLDDIIKSYVKWDNILKEKIDEVDYSWDYIKKNKEYLKKLWFARYNTLIEIFSDMREYKQELFDLFGNNWKFNYLIILQNSNEKRPNWGFFWSFAFVTFDNGHLTNLEIIDSYYPDFIAHRTRIMAPSWTSPFLPDRKIWYIAGNKFWFTDVDGKNLKDLYEKMFNETYDIKKVEQTMQPDLYEKVLHQYIKWVIFIKSDSLEKIIPWLTEKLWEWQFVNANIDLIRWEVRGNKKELYIDEVKDFFAKNKIKIVKNVVNNFDTMLDDQFLNIYLSNASTWFESVFKKHKLQNVFDDSNIYAWDTNVSYNKVDGFVTKNIQISDEEGKIVVDTNNDIVSLSGVSKWNYEMDIYYTLNVPESYINLMHSFEEKYNVKMTERELGILAMNPAEYLDEKYGKVYKWRETKSTIYFPKNIKINDVQWETYYWSKFQPDFANGLFYQMGTNVNHTTKSLKINLTIN